MNSEDHIELKTSVRDKHGWSRPGDVDVLVNGTRVGGLSFGVYDDDRVVETLQYSLPEEFRGQGLGIAMFAEILKELPEYEVRVSDWEPTSDSARLIKAIREGNPAKGRPPLPYHFPTCFLPGKGCECPLGGRTRAEGAGGTMG